MTRQSSRTRVRTGRLIRFTPVLALALAMGMGHEAGVPAAATAASSALPAPPANGEMGFAVTEFHASYYRGDDKVDCPDGFLGVLRDSYMRSLPQAEQDRLNKKENENEREAAWKAYGRNAQGGNLCANIYEFMDRPPTKMMKGPVAIGLNLDGDDTGAGNDPYTCKHANFTSPAGEKGVDHQLWRVQGCSEAYRGPDGSGNTEIRRAYDDFLKTGQWSQVILLRGVNSLVNDPDVQVIYANTNDRPTLDSNGHAIHKASYSVAEDKLQFRNVLRGRIVNGVLTTDPKLIQLNQSANGPRGMFDLDRGRLRLEFQPDGMLKGIVGGYQPLLNLLGAPRGGGAGSVNVAGIDCAGQYTALRMMADGDKDPKTGQCRKISYAYDLVAVPGFVNDLEPARKVAAK